MAHEAMIAGKNAALKATLDTAGWMAAASVDLIREPDGVRARSVAPGVEGAPVPLRGFWTAPELVSFAALYNTNLDQVDTHELRFYADATRTELLWTSGRVPVIPPPLDPADLEFEDERKFSGGLYPDDWLAWPANVYLFPPGIYAMSFEWLLWGSGLRPDGLPAAGVEVDHFWLGEGVFFTLQEDTGFELDTGASDRREGNRKIVEPGQQGRTASLPLAFVKPGLVDRIITLVRAAGGTAPLAWVPNRDDPATSFMYGFLARASKMGRRWPAGGWASTSIDLEEI